MQLARDATAAGDRIAAENFYQHAEHYYRMINANAGGFDRAQQQQPQAQRPPVPGEEQPAQSAAPATQAAQQEFPAAEFNNTPATEPEPPQE